MDLILKKATMQCNYGLQCNNSLPCNIGKHVHQRKTNVIYIHKTSFPSLQKIFRSQIQIWMAHKLLFRRFLVLKSIEKRFEILILVMPQSIQQMILCASK